MSTTFKCVHCGKEIELTKALSHEIEEKVKSEQDKKHKEELSAAKEKHTLELDKAKETLEKKAIIKAEKEFKNKISKLEKDLEEDKNRSRKLIKQLEKLNDEMRALRRKDEERTLEMKKTLALEEEKIRRQTLKEAAEEHELKDKEKDKMLSDLKRSLEEAKRKAQQGSQQTQGEVLELEIEEVLKKDFPEDEIVEVKKGERGADVIQSVIDKKGQKCGEILWESKNAKWSKGWLAKLKEDQRQRKSELAVLVTTNPPEEVHTFGYENGVWICTRKAVSALSLALRYDLIKVNYERLTNVGKNKKSEILYQYVTSIEFRHRIEAIADAFGNLQNEMEREKRWFHTKWARQEKELRKVLDHTHGMYGDLQGVVGKSLPEISSLELEDGEV